jgi:DHA1 family multidrug resistance protein-like MFS transporter
MDEVSRELEKAALDAGPSRHSEDGDHLSRAESISSGSISSSSSSEPDGNPVQMEQIQTSYDLERHPTVLSRIATQRSQHSGTVGASLKSRVSTKPLPPFGAGKAYPPPLPAKETYVVEFEGPDDPLHPQNWTGKKK